MPAAGHDVNVASDRREARASTQALIYTIDRSFRITSVNAAWNASAVAHGLPHLQAPAIIGTNLLDWMHGPPREETRHLCDTVFRGEVRQYEYQLDCASPEERQLYAMTVSPVYDGNGSVTGVTFVSRNLADHQETEARDEIAARAMARLKDDFLSVAAHELKTPLTALKGYTQLALKRMDDRPELRQVRRALETIDKQADRVTELVQKLLDVSYIQSGKLELELGRFDLQALIEFVAEDARLMAPAQVIEVAAHEPILVTADQLRLEQVLYNLLDNAIKYSPGAGSIQVIAGVAGDAVRVAVHDQGVGIPADKLRHIFDRWYQAHHGARGDYGGMGLGLYICSQIIERHGGQMWATSTATTGTSVGFVIPLQASGMRDPQRAETGRESGRFDREANDPGCRR